MCGAGAQGERQSFGELFDFVGPSEDGNLDGPRTLLSHDGRVSPRRPTRLPLPAVRRCRDGFRLEEGDQSVDVAALSRSRMKRPDPRVEASVGVGVISDVV